MRTVTKDELTKILADHRLWRESGGREGARADLTDAYLARADLTDADLAHANLTDAYFTDADLAHANLTDADLTRADLADANLADADLTRADLTDAYLAGAYLAHANLTDAIGIDPNTPRTDPPEPYVRDRTPDYAGRAARYRERHPQVPVVERLDSRILGLVESGEGKLDMRAWHTCETTHCRAGWAVTLAGEAGKKLEDEVGSYRAGSMIYRASTGRSPHFFATDEAALEDIRVCAAQEAAPPTKETP
jgi:hypothetical protein